MLNDTTLATLEASLRGELIQRNEPGYEEARQMYNGMIDLREFPDGRGRGAHPGDLWRQLRPSGRHQAPVRPDPLLPR